MDATFFVQTAAYRSTSSTSQKQQLLPVILAGGTTPTELACVFEWDGGPVSP